MRRTVVRAVPAVTAVLAAAVGCAAPPTAPQLVDRVVLVAVPGGVAASSTFHGPFRQHAGQAWGFAHDALGAALAASHLGVRVTGDAGPDVAETTLRQQCWGTVDDAVARLASAQPAPDRPPRDDLVPTALYYRVIAGDGRGDQVVVSLLADTVQARTKGGYARIDATLRRERDDWLLRVPVQTAGLHPDVDGYTLLGPTS